MLKMCGNDLVHFLLPWSIHLQIWSMFLELCCFKCRKCVEEKRNNIQFHWWSTWLCGHRRLNVKRRVAGLNRIWCRVLCTSIWHFIYIVSINPSLIGADPCWWLTCDELVPFIWIELLTVNFNFGTKTKCIFYDFLSVWCPLRADKL